MARRAQSKPPSTLHSSTYERKPFTWLKRAPYNPKERSDAQIDAICASIVKWGIVDPFIAADDGELIGGHQREEAIQKLLAGKFKQKVNGKATVVKWSLPEDGCVPVMVVHNLSAEQRRMLNIALTKTEGEFDDAKLSDLLASLHRGMGVDIDDLASGTGFTAAEIDKVMEAIDKPNADGDKPAPNKGVPKLSFEFLDKNLRDAVKRAVAAKNKEGKPSGEVLAQLLGVSVAN